MSIFRRLYARDVCSLARCSKTLYAVATSDDVWLPLFQRRFFSFSPDTDGITGRDLYRRFSRYNADFRTNRVRFVDFNQSARPRGQLRLDMQEETVFSVVCPPNTNCVIAGGSIPHCSVSDLDTGVASMHFSFASGLGMGLSHNGTLAGGGFNGHVSVIWGVEGPDPVRFLKNQSVRFLKTQLALHKRSWADIQEKSELIDKLMSLVAVGTVPTFAPSVQFQAAANGLVDVLVEDDFLFTGGWDTKVQALKFKGRGVEPAKVAEFVGHTEGVNCIRRSSPEQLATAGSDGFVKFWDMTTNACVGSYHVSNNWIWCLDVRENNLFYSAGVDHKLVAFDTRANAAAWSVLLPAEVSGLASQPCNNLLATTSFDGAVRTFDNRRHAVPLSCTSVSGERLTRCVMTPDKVVCGSFDGCVKVVSFGK